MTTAAQPLCRLDDLDDGNSKGLQHQQQALLAIRQGNMVYLYHNCCPHLGLPLEWQADQFLNRDKTLIQCATHGALFDIASGECIYGPCEGQHLTPVASYIKDGYVYIADV